MVYDVAIIGAGVIGSVTARELMRFRLKVAVLEKENDVAMGASKANSGIIHGGFDPEPDTLKAKLNVKGVPMLYDTAKELNVPFKQNGSLVCAFGSDEEPALRELYERGMKNGVREMSLISGNEARVLEPQLSEKVTAALRVPTAGIICPYELTIAAMGNAMDNGADLLLNFAVTAIEREENFELYSSDGRHISAKYVINCAGCYSDRVAKTVGDESFKIIPRAGEYMLLDKAEGGRVGHTVFQVPTSKGKGILVTPTVDGNLLTGPTAAAVEQPDQTETTSDGLQTVKRLSLKSVPTVDFRAVITSFSGVRSSVKGGDFIIEESRAQKGFVNVVGIDSPGLSSSVAIAKHTVEILKNAGLELEPNPDFNGFRTDPHAFKKMNECQKDEYIKMNPTFGRIICRCETVSEGEIRDAIRRNPKPNDIDGVKRRTRSGMGRCQGGFCQPFVMRLIAEEQNVPETEITKSGKDSHMLSGEM